ncbi:lysozyme inhibitor LprI family protein [Chthonobacter albigriseus]|uniref:lysozyme inhibitor LprI family protein n=1 Tax=Chthonobacter albigriseus TaxID=1683161 RepID=UPI0015EF8AB6|nr:lysozyme inhibitor LprI family protein [Chthonobacter albigriseus]
MRGRSLRGGALATILFAVSGPPVAAAANPSFDCDRAKGEIETLICGDDELAALDVELAKAFAAAMSRAPASEVSLLRQDQSQWRKSRNECRRLDDIRGCTLDAYRKRLSEL